MTPEKLAAQTLRAYLGMSRDQTRELDFYLAKRAHTPRTKRGTKRQPLPAQRTVRQIHPVAPGHHAVDTMAEDHWATVATTVQLYWSASRCYECKGAKTEILAGIVLPCYVCGGKGHLPIAPKRPSDCRPARVYFTDDMLPRWTVIPHPLYENATITIDTRPLKAHRKPGTVKRGNRRSKRAILVPWDDGMAPLFDTGHSGIVQNQRMED